MSEHLTTETIQVSSTPEPAPVAAPAHNRKPLVIAGIVAACLVAALVGFLVRPNDGSVGGTSSSTGFNNPATLEASVQNAYQQSFADGGYYNPITVSCIPTGIAHQFTCLLKTSSSYGEPISASHTVTVTPSGDDWIADSR